jgi:hypothetical protein
VAPGASPEKAVSSRNVLLALVRATLKPSFTLSTAKVAPFAVAACQRMTEKV